MDVWRRMIAAQGSDPDAPLPAAREREVVVADRDGVLERLDAYAVGVAAWRLGAGRSRPGERVSPGAGVQWHARPGDRVVAGSPLFTLHSDDPARFSRAREALAGGWALAPAGTAAPLRPSLILDRVG